MVESVIGIRSGVERDAPQPVDRRAGWERVSGLETQMRARRGAQDGASPASCGASLRVLAGDRWWSSVHAPGRSVPAITNRSLRRTVAPGLPQISGCVL